MKIVLPALGDGEGCQAVGVGFAVQKQLVFGGVDLDFRVGQRLAVRN